MPPASYETLVTETRPQVIETWKRYQTIAQRFGDFVGKGRARSAEETKLMHLLGLVIQDYDRRHAMPPDDSAPADRLQYLLEHSGNTSADLLPVFGQRSHEHEALTANRPIRPPQQRKLGQ